MSVLLSPITFIDIQSYQYTYWENSPVIHAAAYRTCDIVELWTVNKCALSISTAICWTANSLIACTRVATSSICEATSDPCWLPSMRVNSTNTLTYLQKIILIIFCSYLIIKNYLTKTFSKKFFIGLCKAHFLSLSIPNKFLCFCYCWRSKALYTGLSQQRLWMLQVVKIPQYIMVYNFLRTMCNQNWIQ